ncbi:hypothetical protein [Robiginitalea biformata]|nr:hypothetical protein [Robiginitalea biformata]
MRTPQTNQQVLSLPELMRITAELRANGFRPSRSAAGHTSRQLRGAVASFLHYRRSIRMALFVHLMLVVLLLGSWLASPGWYTAALCLGCFTGFLCFLLMGRYHRSAYFQSLGQKRQIRDHWIGLLGLPLYFLLYFRFEKKMREELSRLFHELGLTSHLRVVH